MHRALAENSCGCVIEVHSVSFENRNVVLPRLHKVMAASGCWTFAYKRRGRQTMEYSFDIELRAVMELYCGLAQAGLEMSEVSHRALTELCVLRRHEQMLGGSRRLTARVVKVRLRMGFVDAEEEMGTAPVIAASA